MWRPSRSWISHSLRLELGRSSHLTIVSVLLFEDVVVSGVTVLGFVSSHPAHIRQAGTSSNANSLLNLAPCFARRGRL